MGRRRRDGDGIGIGIGDSIPPRRIDVEPELVYLGPARSRPGCSSRRRVGTGACPVQIGLAGLKAHQIAGRFLGLTTACTCSQSWSWIWPCGTTCSVSSWVHMKPSIVHCGGGRTSMQHFGSASTVLSLALGATHQTGLISLRRPRGIVGPVVAVVAALLSLLRRLLLLMPIPRTAVGSAATASSGLILRVGPGGIVGMQVVRHAS